MLLGTRRRKSPNRRAAQGFISEYTSLGRLDRYGIAQCSKSRSPHSVSMAYGNSCTRNGIRKSESGIEPDEDPELRRQTRVGLHQARQAARRHAKHVGVFVNDCGHPSCIQG